MSGPERRRILHIDKFGSRVDGGGAAGYMLEILARQRAAGHTVDFLATDGVTDVTSGLRDLFPPRHHFSPPPSGLRDRATTAGQMIWSRTAARSVEQAIERFRPDVVHCHNTYHHLTPSIFRPIRRAGIPIAMTVHDFKLVCPTYRMIDGSGAQCDACVEGSVVNVVKRRCQSGSLVQSAVLMAESGLHRRIGAYDAVGAFVCPSEHLANLLRRGGFGDRVHHLPSGYDLDSVTPRTEPGTGVAYVGRLSWEKGVDHLIEAVALLDEVHLTVCGDGPQRADLEALAAARLPGRITFRGHLGRAEVLAELSCAAVAAVPSVWSENQPLAIIEAMACGVPVVCGDEPALREMVVADESGTTVDPRDHRALATALERFVTDPELQRRLAITARARAERIHDMRRHLDALDATYTRLIAGSGTA